MASLMSHDPIMEHMSTSTSQAEPRTLHSRSSSGSMSTPSSTVSMHSRGQTTRSPASSISMAPSPLPARNSFDQYGSAKRLEDVREEAQEPDGDWTELHDEKCFHVGHYKQASLYLTSRTASLVHTDYSLGDPEQSPTTAAQSCQLKRQRSLENRHSISDRFANRFGSLSRRWKHRSSIGPQLSIITHTSLPVQRSSSAASSHIVSPALSAISKHESLLPASPTPNISDDMWQESVIVPLYIDNGTHTPIEEEREQDQEQEQVQATTPLLPPVLAQLSIKKDSPLQSPLQSPSIAATSFAGAHVAHKGSAAHALPSPPLSHQPSKASMHRSRDSAGLISDIPPLHLVNDDPDLWGLRLGHANFCIHPEPYEPDRPDLESYREFRANWELARKQYAQHLARTIEHYGETSKVYRLTQEKWAAIDDTWKMGDAALAAVVSPSLLRYSDSDTAHSESIMSPDMLEKPLTRIDVPPLDNSGKFPEIGDADIIGPLSTVAPRAPELQRRSPQTPPQSPRKRTLLKYLTDVLGRHNS